VDFTRPACDAFKRHEVKRVVGVSALGRGVAGNAGLVSGSLAMDDLIASTGVSYRALTMPSFMAHSPPPPPASANGAKQSSSQPSWPDHHRDKLLSSPASTSAWRQP
jgi:hypothetical protein